MFHFTQLSSNFTQFTQLPNLINYLIHNYLWYFYHLPNSANFPNL